MQTQLRHHHHPLHQKALFLAQEFKRIESELLEIFRQIDCQLLYRRLGYTSLHDYAMRALSLSESTACALIAVARKSLEVPELKLALDSGELSISQARKITPVINAGNATQWLVKASSLTNRQLEREVAQVNPRSVRESTKYVSGERVEVKLGLSESSLKKFKRAQDLESQRTKTHCNLEKTLENVVEFYLKKNDPLLDQRFGRRLIHSPSARKEALRSSDARCTYVYADGARCTNERWLDVHHKKHRSQGGGDEPGNLTVLCSAHHQFVHAQHE
jgi:hypothetical protein